MSIEELNDIRIYLWHQNLIEMLIRKAFSGSAASQPLSAASTFDIVVLIQESTNTYMIDCSVCA